jgi:hypothetical protein
LKKEIMNSPFSQDALGHPIGMAIIQPRVARNELPWVIAKISHEPCKGSIHAVIDLVDLTLAGFLSWGALTQGSGCFATRNPGLNAPNPVGIAAATAENVQTPGFRREAESGGPDARAPNKTMPSRLAAAVLLLALLCGRVGAAGLAPNEAEFFESKIRPILVNNCYKCHSKASEKLKGGLRLDTAADLRKGGNTGPALVPGHPENSLLLKAVSYRDEDLKMPPNDRKLPDSQIADLEQWVRMGAPDPRTSDGGPIKLYEIDKANASGHWAFQPIFPPKPPQAEDPDHWAQSPIDNYILARLRQEGLAPSKQADKTTLIRRATFDLTGLPPTLKEVEDFLADDSPNAFSNVVVRLLASPRYGERWGRYWLDVARYADTKGAAGDADPRYPFAFTYRDWVIKAFNDDLPYDKFLLNQIAADQLPGETPAALAALGFLTVGNRFNNNSDDIIDDRIDVVCKGTMALTVTCARCHDHKFDPIPTMDYYSLHGIFASCAEPEEEPIIQPLDQNGAYKYFQRDVKLRETELDNFRRDARHAARKKLISQTAEYMLTVAELFNSTNKEAAEKKLVRARQLNGRWLFAWESALDASRQSNPIFDPWVALAAVDAMQFSLKARALALPPAKPLVAPLLSPAPTSLAQLATRYANLFLEAETRAQAASAQPAREDAASRPEAELWKTRNVFDDPGSPLFLNERLVDEAVNRDRRERDQIQKLEKAVADVKANHPGAPIRAMALADKGDPRDSYVHIKGNAGNRGPEAPRRFLAILSTEERPAFHEGSGRLELAKDIASEDNPLTARVMVNRLWQWHFGEGLVETPNDFGLRSKPPSHPELLDYLAWEFIEQGWSIKKMHLLIMLSSTYQQSSEGNPRQAQIDPLNHLLWRAHRRRLDFEALRDTILFIGGRLDTNMGGRAVKLDSIPYSERRTVYGLVDRGSLPNMYRAFDFANPDLCTGKRDVTTVPQQALFLMNSPLVVEQAMNLVRRPDFSSLSKDNDRIRLLFRLIYQRSPNEAELRMALTYLQSESLTPKAPIEGDPRWEYGTGQFDPISKRIRNFRPMRKFDKGAWVDDLGGALTAEGGRTSGFPETLVVRRWTSPVDGVVNIAGTLSHKDAAGGGVRARVVVSAGSGELGSWTAYRSAAEASLKAVPVREGETVDFTVDCLGGAENEEFDWSPVITSVPPTNGIATAAQWAAGREFSGSVHRRLSVWEKFAQVLLETNELAYYN